MFTFLQSLPDWVGPVAVVIVAGVLAVVVMCTHNYRDHS